MKQIHRKSSKKEGKFSGLVSPLKFSFFQTSTRVSITVWKHGKCCHKHCHNVLSHFEFLTKKYGNRFYCLISLTAWSTVICFCFLSYKHLILLLQTKIDNSLSNARKCEVCRRFFRTHLAPSSLGLYENLRQILSCPDPANNNNKLYLRRVTPSVVHCSPWRPFILLKYNIQKLFIS